MPEPAPEQLLLGILAVQKDFIGREDLVAAVRAWAADLARPLGRLLVERQALAPDQLDYLEALTRDQLARHGDAHRALTACDPEGSLWPDLSAIVRGAARSTITTAPDRHDATVTWGAEPGPTPVRDDATLTWSDTPATPARQGPLPITQRYTVLRAHACSGLGLVLIARDDRLGREVALKEIEPEHDARPGDRARFLREAEVAARLEHPGVLPVYGLGALPDGRPFYAMRFFEGESLAAAVAAHHRRAGHLPAGEQSLALRRLLGHFVAACRAAHYAHGRGVTHGALSPHAIALGRHGETFLLEWGQAQVAGHAGSPWPADQETEIFSSPGRLTQSSDPDVEATVEDLSGVARASALASPAYLSPERAGERWHEVGPASDVYSLGATLYHLLTGRPPLEGDDGTVLRRAQRGEFPPPRRVNAGVPRVLEAVCLKAMTTLPRARHGSAAALADDVERWLAGEPVPAYREPVAVKAGRWLRRHGAAAALLLVAAGLGLALWLRSDGADEARLAAEREAGARDAAAQARHEVLASYARAERAVEESLQRTAEDPRLKEPDPAGLRRHLLKRAAAFYEEFLAAAKQGGASEAELARAHAALGLIHKELSERKEGIARYLEAVAIFRRLAGRDPARVEHGYALGTACLGLGELYLGARELADAEKALREALPLLEKAPDPERAARQRRDLGAAHLALARVHAAAGRHREARDAGQKAVTTFARLVLDDPVGTDHRARLAEACDVSAAALLALREPHEAVARQGVTALDPVFKQGDSVRLRPLLASLQARAPAGATVGGALVVGGEIKGKLTEADPLDDFRPKAKAYARAHEINLAAGKSYLIDLAGDFDTFLRLTDAAGRTLLFNDDITPDGASETALHSRLVFTPREAGKYRLIVTSYKSGVTGDYQLRVREAEAAGKPLVQKGELTEKEKEGGDQYVLLHKVEMIKGRAYVIEATSAAFAPRLFLMSAGGKDTVASGAGKQTARIDYTPARTETFVFAVVGGSPGAYTFRVTAYVPAKAPPP